MFRNVLIGVDGSPTGRDAVALAVALAEPDARLTLVHVYGGMMTPGRTANASLASSARAASERLLEGERELAGVRAELLSVLRLLGRARAARGSRGAPCGPARGRLQQPRPRGPRARRRRHPRLAQRRLLRGRGRAARVCRARRRLPADRRRLRLLAGEPGGARSGARARGARRREAERPLRGDDAGVGLRRGDAGQLGRHPRGGPQGGRGEDRRSRAGCRRPRSTASRSRSSHPSAIASTCSSSAHATTGRSGAWCWAAPPAGSPATRAAHCWCCRERSP